MVETLGTVAALTMTSLFAGLLLLVPFMLLVQPIWCIVDCAVDNQRGRGSKIVWIILLIVLYGVTNWFFGAFAARNPVLRWLTRVAWLIAILLVALFAYAYFNDGGFQREFDRRLRDREVMVLAPTDLASPLPIKC
jgi:hypothetical protein